MAAFTIASVSGVRVIFTCQPLVFTNDFHADHIAAAGTNEDLVAGSVPVFGIDVGPVCGVRDGSSATARR
jgi:hypothetical protein